MNNHTSQERQRKRGTRSRRGHIAAGSGFLAAIVVLGGGGLGIAPLLGSSQVEPTEESEAPLDEISLDPDSVPELGDDVRVVIDDGESFVDGSLEAATDEQVILRVRGLILPLERSRVVSITVRLTPGQRYRDIRPTIRDDDVPRLLQLVRWLEQNRLYDEALRELEGILRQNPENEEARRLVDLVNQLIVLEQIRERRQANQRERERPAAQRPAAQMPERNRFEPLTPEQINLIKVYELDLRSKPRLLIQRSTYDELLKRYAEHPLIPVTREGKAEFYKKPAVEIMDIMFRVGARDLYGEVQVIGQPESMTTFRDQISARWLTNRCATTRCHGGSEAGRLKLLNRAPNSEATVYTNFLILDRFDTRQPVPMIDYTNPSDSLLLQMALPREDVLYPHPDVKGWRPVFLSERSQQYRAAMAWMRMMYQPRPDYPIEYSPGVPAEGEPVEPEPDDRIER